jgi:mannan endo-1,4-beta-mannosidase
MSRLGRGAVVVGALGGWMLLGTGLPAPAHEEGGATTELRETMYVEGRTLFDANGAVFVARGVNLQYGDNPPEKQPSIPLLDQVHSNIVRLQVRANTTAEELRVAMDAIVANRMIAMPMLWEQNVTGSRDPQAIAGAVDLWTGRHLAVLTDPAYQKYLLLNIANEWGYDFTQWLETYRTAIARLRATGIRVPLVVDATDWGHDPTVFGGGRGQSLLEADPLHQVIFSVHGYYEWPSAADVNRNFDELVATGLCLMIGEFGALDHLIGGRPTDHWAIMSRAQAEGIGWMAWSWRGNGPNESMLDMSASYTEVQLTARGEDIVNGPNGLMETSRRASYWPAY